jgi:hypothetical protein
MDKKRCATGERKDPKTGKCVKMSEELIKHKQSLRNKKKGVVFDEMNNKIKPAKRVTVKKRPVKLVPITEEPDEITNEKIDKSIDILTSDDNKTPNEVIKELSDEPESKPEKSEEPEPEKSEEPEPEKSEEPEPEKSEEPEPEKSEEPEPETSEEPEPEKSEEPEPEKSEESEP